MFLDFQWLFLLNKYKDIFEWDDAAFAIGWTRMSDTNMDDKKNRTVLTQSKYEALEDIREIIPLTNDELNSIFSVLEKAKYGRLEFVVGNTIINFQSCSFCTSDPVEINVEVEVGEEDSKYISKYTFQHGLRKKGLN